MTLIIEVLRLKDGLSRRITPFFNVHSVYATRGLAMQYLNELKNEYQANHIESWFDQDSLVISDDPGRGFANISYKLEDAILYGDRVSDQVYHLMKFRGYLTDQDKPYRYNNLGWFSSPIWAKRTKEWQIMRHIINTRDDIDGIETDNEIRIFGPYECTDINPSLIIRSYPLKK